MLTSNTLSYAQPSDPLWRRWLIRSIETLTGARAVRRLYEDVSIGPADCFWTAALDALEIEVRCPHPVPLPSTGPAVVVANHPYGIVDGLAACHLIHERRADFKVLLHRALCQTGRFRDHFLPVDFRDSAASRATNVRTLRTALRHVQEGGCVLVFPAGGVATSPTMLAEAQELPWHPFVARLVRSTKAPALPLHFAGQASRLFQVASHLSTHLRLALVIHEVWRHAGRPLDVRAGALIRHHEAARHQDLNALTQFLRRRTLALQPAR